MGKYLTILCRIYLPMSPAKVPCFVWKAKEGSDHFFLAQCSHIAAHTLTKNYSKTATFSAEGLYMSSMLMEILCSFQCHKPEDSISFLCRERLRYVKLSKLQTCPKSPFLTITWLRFDEYCSKAKQDIKKIQTPVGSWENLFQAIWEAKIAFHWVPPKPT